MFAMFVSSTPKSRTWKNIFRRCQISHWTKLEAPYKGCTVICTFLIKCSSLKIMKFFIENFFLNFLPRKLREIQHLISNPLSFQANFCRFMFIVVTNREPRTARSARKILLCPGNIVMTNFFTWILFGRKKVKIRVNLSDIISIT